MASALIQVGIAELESLESRIRQLDCAVDSALRADFSRSGAVAHAYSSVMEKWDRNRREVETALAGIADTVRSVVDAFEQADNDLAAALTATGSP